MQQTFALAKIQPPLPRANVVVREALARRLRSAVQDMRLTLLCAPAGFGKTVALTQTIHAFDAAQMRIAWVSVDEDDDLPRFLACLSAALEPFDLPWRRAPEGLVALAGEGRAGRSQVADELVNALHAIDGGRGLMVFDDLHRTNDPGVFELIELLVARLPAPWSVAIGTRVEPPLPLARWRAGGELAELRQDDLRFSAADVQALVGAQPQNTGWSADELLRRTQGWPAGLRLSLHAAPGGTPAAPGGAAQRHLFDYLATEVLDDMPAGLREFLLLCSVLSELTATRCEQLTDDPRAAQWLDEIERRGLFVAVLDSAELTLRLHDLFRDFLEDRLRRERPAQWAQLLVRAAGHETDVMRRVNLLMRAGAWQDAQLVLVRAIGALLLAGGHAQVLRVVDQFPREQQESSPLLAYARGLCAWPRFEWVTMQRAMDRAARGFAAAGMTAQAQQAAAFETVGLMALGRIEEAGTRLDAIRALPLERDTEALAELMMYWRTGAVGPARGPALHLERMLDLLEGRVRPELGVADAAVWYRCTPHFMFTGRAGLRAPMERWVRGALAVAGDHTPLRAAAKALQAWLMLWQGRLDEAQRLMLEVQDDDRWLGQPRSLRIPILAFHAAWHFVQGDRDAMRRAARAMIDDVDGDPERRVTWRGVYLYNLGRLSAALDDDTGLQEALDLLAATPSAREWPHMRGARLAVRGLAALAAGDLAGARTLLEAAVVDSAELDTLSLDVTVRAALARVHLRQGDRSAAWGVFAPVVQLARNAGEPVTLRFAGPGTCAEIVAAPAPPGYADDHAWFAAQVAAWAQPSPSAAAPAQAAFVRPAASPLSDREHDVLVRLAAGDSNKLIARALDLSPHTVKRHVANILDKLALGSRGQAAAWYREQLGADRVT